MNSTYSSGMPAVILFTVIGIIAYADRLILGALFAPLQEELGLSSSELGILQGASFAIVYAASGLISAGLPTFGQENGCWPPV